MKKWEYAMVFVTLDTKGEWTMRLGTDTLKWEGIYNYFDSLGTDGWELVSVVSHIGDTNPQQRGSSVSQEFANLMVGPGVTTMTQHKAGTIGYLFAFKRETAD